MAVCCCAARLGRRERKRHGRLTGNEYRRRRRACVCFRRFQGEYRENISEWTDTTATERLNASGDIIIIIIGSRYKGERRREHNGGGGRRVITAVYGGEEGRGRTISMRDSRAVTAAAAEASDRVARARVQKRE